MVEFRWMHYIAFHHCLHTMLVILLYLSVQYRTEESQLYMLLPLVHHLLHNNNLYTLLHSFCRFYMLDCSSSESIGILFCYLSKQQGVAIESTPECYNRAKRSLEYGTKDYGSAEKDAIRS